MRLLDLLLRPFTSPGLSGGWRRQEALAIEKGRKLTASELADARLAGVACPEKIHIRVVPSIEPPDHWLLSVLPKSMLSSGRKPAVSHLELRHLSPAGLLRLPTNRELYVHEMIHVAQYERCGSIKGIPHRLPQGKHLSRLSLRPDGAGSRRRCSQDHQRCPKLSCRRRPRRVNRGDETKRISVGPGPSVRHSCRLPLPQRTPPRKRDPRRSIARQPTILVSAPTPSKLQKQWLTPDLYARLSRKRTDPWPRAMRRMSREICSSIPRSHRITTRFGSATIDQASAKVPVSLSLPGEKEKREFTVLLQQIKGAWKISDVIYAKGDGKLTTS